MLCSYEARINGLRANYPFFIINEQTIYYTFVSTYVYVQRT